MGVFLRAAAKAKNEKHISDLRSNWYANHLSQKGLNTVISEMTRKLQVMNVTTSKKGDLEPDFIKEQWTGLAMALGKMNRGRM